MLEMCVSPVSTFNIGPLAYRSHRLDTAGTEQFSKSHQYITWLTLIFYSCYEVWLLESWVAIRDESMLTLSFRELYMKTGQGFLLVFSITSLSSLSELSELREQIIRIKDDENVPIVIVGNKSDLEEDRMVSRAKAFSVSQSWGNAPYYETSARRRGECLPVMQRRMRVNRWYNSSQCGRSFHRSLQADNSQGQQRITKWCGGGDWTVVRAWARTER
jgi:GTPase SAR1 family protein